MRSFAPRHRVVSIDLAGHGESGSGRESWTMPAFGGDVAAVARQIGADDLVLVGHSMGGDVIVEAALQLGGCVRGSRLGRRLQRSEPRRGGPGAGAWSRFVAGLRADFRAEVDQFVRGMFPPDADPALVDRSPATWQPRRPRSRSTVRDIAAEPRAGAGRARTLRLPVVSISPAGSDIDEPSMLRAGVRPVYLDGVGHFPMLEAPERFSALLAEVLASFA